MLFDMLIFYSQITKIDNIDKISITAKVFKKTDPNNSTAATVKTTRQVLGRIFNEQVS